MALVTDPKNASILYAGTWGAGVYKSIDGGESWFWSGHGLKELYIDSLTISPVSSNILYAGTHGDGVYKSSDAGATWVPVNNGIRAGTIVYTVAVNPGNENLVYAGSRWGDGSGAPWGGRLYKTSDGGASWTTVLENVGGTEQQDWFYSVAANPAQPNVVLVAAHQFGVYLSTDYGNTWAPSNTGITDKSGRVVAFDGRNQTAYYGTWHGDGVFRSDDNGKSWYKANKGLGAIKIYPNAFSVAPSQKDVLYVGSFATNGPSGILKSVDTGNNWGSAGLGVERIYSVRASPANPSTVFGSPVGMGIYKSTDGGSNWRLSQKGLILRSVSSLAFLWERVMVASTKGSGIFLTPDGGQTWSNFTYNLPTNDVNQVVALPSNPNTLYALTETAGLYRDDLTSGKGWLPVIVPTMTGLSLGETLSLQAVEAGAPIRVEPWQEMEYLENGGLPEPALGYIANAPMLNMVFAPSNDSVVYLTTRKRGVFRSFDAGQSWAAGGLAGLTVQQLAVHPDYPGLVYAVTDQPGKMFVSSDAGTTWAEIPLPAPDLIANAVAVSLWQRDSSEIWVGSSSGVWRYSLGIWRAMGLQGTAVTAVTFNPKITNSVYAGTPNGAWASLSGFQWNQLAPELNRAAVRSILFNPNDPDAVYVTAANPGFARIELFK